MQSYDKQGYAISTEKQETFNYMDEICGQLGVFLVIPEARIESKQLRVVITIFLFIKIKIQLLSAFILLALKHFIVCQHQI